MSAALVASGSALPILLLIAVGWAVRQFRIVDHQGALALTRLVYHVTIPAAVAFSIARVDLTPQLLLLPLIGMTLPTLLAGIMYLTTRRLAEAPRRRGVLLVTLVVMGVFAFPFMELYYGPEGLARIALYDMGNVFYAAILATYLARRFGSGVGRISVRGIFSSPILIGALVGVALAVLDRPLPAVAAGLLQRLATANTPLSMLAVGMFLRPSRGYGALVAQYVGIRMVLGGMLGWGLAQLLGLQGLSLVIATVGSALPAGTTGLVLAGKEGLDTGLAAAIVSSSMLIGVLVVALLPHLLAALYL
ncbi:MAG: AEC family transporter [Anaerolineae bacterium]|jgi:predicted permease|nr:hypothetical protein [Chloroflexota bacterium]